MGQFLEKPNTDKDTSGGTGPGGITYGYASMQGWRIEMEDAHTLYPVISGERFRGWSFFAIFDGHAGDRVSNHSADFLWDCIENRLRMIPSTSSLSTTTQSGSSPNSTGSDQAAAASASTAAIAAGSKSTSNESLNKLKMDNSETFPMSVREISDAVKVGFLTMDLRLRDLPDIRDGLDKSGSTAVCALITPQHLFLINVGDSRAILIRDGHVQMATMDHKPSNDKERKRIIDAGGMVIIQRVNGSLAVSRALGDFEYKADPNRLPQSQLVSPEADIYVTERDMGHDQYLVLACDGIWDVMTNNDVCQFVLAKIKLGRDIVGICTDMLDTCLSRGSKDNMSVIIVSFPMSATTINTPQPQHHTQVSTGSSRTDSKSKDYQPESNFSDSSESSDSSHRVDNPELVDSQSDCEAESSPDSYNFSNDRLDNTHCGDNDDDIKHPSLQTGYDNKELTYDDISSTPLLPFVDLYNSDRETVMNKHSANGYIRYCSLLETSPPHVSCVAEGGFQQRQKRSCSSSPSTDRTSQGVKPSYYNLNNRKRPLISRTTSVDDVLHRSKGNINTNKSD